MQCDLTLAHCNIPYDYIKYLSAALIRGRLLSPLFHDPCKDYYSRVATIRSVVIIQGTVLQQYAYMILHLTQHHSPNSPIVYGLLKQNFATNEVKLEKTIKIEMCQISALRMYTIKGCSFI